VLPLQTTVIERGTKSKWHGTDGSFDLLTFCYDHRETLPVHYHAFCARVGCKKAAASCIESIFRHSIA